MAALVKVPAFQNRARRRQYPHRREGKTEREFCQWIFSRDLTEEFDELPRQQTHQEDVRDEDDNVQQETAIGFGE